MTCKTTAMNLLLLVCMEVIAQLANIEHSGFNSQDFAMVNGTCTLQNSTNRGRGGLLNLLTKGHGLKYFLTIVGSLLSPVLEYRSILWFGGMIMSAGVCLITVVTRFGLICRPVFYYMAWIPYPLYNGLLLPSMFYSFIRWSTGPHSRMLLMVLYYLAAEIPMIIDSTIPHMLEIQLYTHRHSSALVSTAGICLCLAFTALSSRLEAEPNLPQFEQLTLNRLMRYIRILAAFTVFVAQLNDGHVSNYRIEIKYLASISNHNGAEPSWELWAWSVNLTRNVNTAGILAAACALIAMGVSPCTQFLSYQLRIKMTVAIAAATSLGCLIAYLVLGCKAGSWGPVATTSVFGTASFLDGISEVIGIVALYELVDVISTRQNKLLLFGITFTACALSGMFRYGVGVAVHRIASGGTIGEEGSVEEVARLDHAIDCVLSICCLAYAHWLAFPLAFTLEEGQWQHGDQQNVETPLIPSEARSCTEFFQGDDAAGSDQALINEEPSDNDNLTDFVSR